jgi:hypothetical protein
MSQVTKSASAFVRAFLAMLVLELEDMVVRLIRPPKLVNVHGNRWTVRMSGLAQMRSADRVEQCPSSVVKRKTSTRDEYFAFSALKPSGVRGGSSLLGSLQRPQGAPAAPQPQAWGPSQGSNMWSSQTHLVPSQRAHLAVMRAAAAI